MAGSRSKRQPPCGACGHQVKKPGTHTPSTDSGTPLFQEAVLSGVVGWSVAGPGSDFSEASMPGFESTALELVVAPECPPGPVLSAAIPPVAVILAGLTASSTMVR